MSRTLSDTLKNLCEAVISEAERNPDFAQEIGRILFGEDSGLPVRPITPKKGRRDPAVVDPIELFGEGEAVLRERLSGLSEKELKDVIAQYGMDPSRLAMKWRKKEKLIDYIVEASRRMAGRGDAFRE